MHLYACTCGCLGLRFVNQMVCVLLEWVNKAMAQMDDNKVCDLMCYSFHFALMPEHS